MNLVAVISLAILVAIPLFLLLDIAMSLTAIRSQIRDIKNKLHERGVLDDPADWWKHNNEQQPPPHRDPWLYDSKNLDDNGGR